MILKQKNYDKKFQFQYLIGVGIKLKKYIFIYLIEAWVDRFFVGFGFSSCLTRLNLVINEVENLI